MESIYDLIIETYTEGMHIPLIKRGKYYTFIEVSTTKINDIFYNRAIHYRISKENTKKITSVFIELTYRYYVENKSVFPNRNWYKIHPELKDEYKSRPCNYSVAQGLIKVAIKNN